jgi:plasmid rolling circle replication initiator protein Rep
MTKIREKNKNENNSDCLDTLAQLSTNPCNCQDPNQLALQKRARSKAFTFSYLFDLIDLNSPLKKSYWNTYHCSSVILQEGKKITSKYCNARWCLVCNRIRTAKIINGYKPSIDLFKDPHFMTLTTPNVKAKNLLKEIEHLNDCVRRITKNLQKTYGIKVKALKKVECTYNNNRNDYNPHLHFIIDGKEIARQFKKQWLRNNRFSNPSAQDITTANDTSLIELCKYFTKIITKDNDYNPKAQDIIFRAMKGKRTFQPIGIKKDVSEDIEEIQSQEMDFKPPMNEVWVYEKEVFDWVSAQGETLTEYEPTKEDLKVINKDYDKYS